MEREEKDRRKELERQMSRAEKGKSRKASRAKSRRQIREQREKEKNRCVIFYQSFIYFDLKWLDFGFINFRESGGFRRVDNLEDRLVGRMHQYGNQDSMEITHEVS